MFRMNGHHWYWSVGLLIGTTFLADIEGHLVCEHNWHWTCQTLHCRCLFESHLHLCGKVCHTAYT